VVDAAQPALDAVTGIVLNPVGHATGPLAGVLGPVTDHALLPATSAVAGSVGVVAAPAAPVAEVVAPALQPVVAPVVGGVLRPVRGALDGTPLGDALDAVVGALRPVTDVLKPPAAAPPPVVVAPGTPPVAPPAPLPPGQAFVGPRAGLLPHAAAHAAPAAAGTAAVTPAGRDTALGTASEADGAARTGSAPTDGDSPVPPAPSAPVPSGSGSGSSGGQPRTPAGQDVLAVLPALAVPLGGSGLLATAGDRVELPLDLRDVPVFPA